MKRLLYIIILIGFTNYLNGQKLDVFQTGQISKKKFSDTIWVKGNDFVVLPIQINGVDKLYMFDTGADLIVSSDLDSTTLSQIKMNVSDINGLTTIKKLHRINNVYINGIEISDMFSIELELPEPFLCFADGIIGNNLIKSLNWKIQKDYIVLTNQKIKYDYQKVLKTFSYGTNCLHINTTINGVNIDSCLIDYGGLYEIKLPMTIYTNNFIDFENTNKYQFVKSSYGAHGKGKVDTVIVANCDLEFNGIKINNVNVTFSNRPEKQIGVLFLKRFQSIVLDNAHDKIAFGELDMQNRGSKIYNYDFDLIESKFVVKNAILKDEVLIKYGDEFININNKSSDSFMDYCEFLKWKKNLMENEYIELIKNNGEKIRIKNWH